MGVVAFSQNGGNGLVEFTTLAQQHAIMHNEFVPFSRDAYMQWGEFADNPFLNPKAYRHYNNLRLGLPYVCKCGKPTIPRGDYEIFYCLDCKMIYASTGIIMDSSKHNWAEMVATENGFCVKDGASILYLELQKQITV